MAKSMSKQEIRNKSGKIIGYIESAGSGKLRAYSNMNRHLGTYESTTDRTFKPNNSLVGEGNHLVALIYEEYGD